jgi:hypothetical protein
VRNAYTTTTQKTAIAPTFSRIGTSFDDAFAPRPKAAPVLRTCTSWKKFGMTGTASCS